MHTTNNKSNRNHRTLGFQPLESRALLTGNVAIKVIGGDLKITGDGKDNQVAIVQTMQNGATIAGSYYISGLNGTTINGHSQGQYFTGVSHDFLLNFGGGNDRVTLGDNVSESHFQVPHDLKINMGDGRNQVLLKKITVADHALVQTGNGTDKFDIRGKFGVSAVNNGEFDLAVLTGGGSDNLNIHNTFVKRDLLVDTGADASTDTVRLGVMNVGHDLVVHNGNGNNTVAINSVGVNHDLRVIGGSGKETVSINESEAADLLFVDLGAGDDSLTLTHSDGNRADLRGNTGHDTLATLDLAFANFQTSSF